MLRLVTEATTEPITLAEAKAWLDISADTWDDKITSGIKSARATIEKALGFALVETVYDYYIYNYDGFIDLPYHTVAAVNSVKSTDGSGVQTTVNVSEYQLIGNRLNISTANTAIVINYTVSAEGTNGETLSERIKLIIKKQLAYDFKNAEDKTTKEDIERMCKAETINLGF